jgi:hypothetical protein
MSTFDEAFDAWRRAKFPDGSPNDDVDDIHAVLAQLDAFVADEVIPLHEGRTIQYRLASMLGDLSDLQARIGALHDSAGPRDKAKLKEYADYCRLLQDVYALALESLPHP